MPGIDTEAFMRQQAIASNLHEQSILGYRGLTGNDKLVINYFSLFFKENFHIKIQQNRHMKTTKKFIS